MTVNYVNKNVKARNINKKKSQASRGKQNKKTGHVQRTRNQNSIRPEDNEWSIAIKMLGKNYY